MISAPAKKSRNHTNDTHPPPSNSSRTPELSVYSNATTNNAFGAISHAGAGPGLKFGYEPQQPAAALTINTVSMQNMMQQAIKVDKKILFTQKKFLFNKHQT